MKTAERRALARMALIGLLAGAAPAAPAGEADGDGDGIPDAIEAVLGTDPRTPEEFRTVYDDGAKAAGDRDIRADHRLAPDITTLSHANPAGNRYVWRVDFADDFLAPGTVFILYLDTDNDPGTGRSGGPPTGTDVMLTCVDGTFSAAIHNPAAVGLDRAMRGARDGRTLWLSMDLNLHSPTPGEAEYRAYILCHRRPETADADYTPWFPVRAPGNSPGTKARVLNRSELLSRGVRAYPARAGLRAAVAAVGGTPLKAEEAAVDGMVRVDRALSPARPGATARWLSPVEGPRHLLVTVTDAPGGPDCLSVESGAARLQMTAAEDNGQPLLFVTTEPIQLRAGTPITLRAEETAQDFLISEVILAPSAPSPPPTAIRRIATYARPGAREGTVAVDVCWTTDEATAGRVLWGTEEAFDQGTEEDAPGGHNHVAVLPDIPAGTEIRARIEAGAAEEVVSGPEFRFRADLKRPTRGTVDRGMIVLIPATSGPAPLSRIPLRGGVPFPAGALVSERNCRLTTENGTPIPASFAATARWPDGSIRWLLVSLVHEPEAGNCRLEYGNSVESPPFGPAYSVLTEGRGITLSSDDLRVRLLPGETIPRIAPAGADNSPILISAPGGLVLTGEDGTLYQAGNDPAASCTVEANGPGETVTVARGRLRSEGGGTSFGYEVRTRFPRGFRGVRVSVTLRNDTGTRAIPPDPARVRSVEIPLRVPGSRPGTFSMLADAPDTVIRSPADAADSQVSGFVSVPVGDGAVSIFLKDFTEKYPSAIRRTDDEVRIALFPALPADRYPTDRDPKALTRNEYWFDSGAYLIPAGTAVTREFTIAFGQDADTDPAVWRGTALLAASPETYCASGAFGELRPERAGVFDRYAAFADAGFEVLRANREKVPEYSWINFGDWYGERGVNWGNLEYDLQLALLLHFARTGDMRFLEDGLRAADHHCAIDVITASPNPTENGRMHIHSVGHTGGFDIPRVPDAAYWYVTGNHDIGHTWTRGDFTAYCLTGESRFRDAAASAARYVAREYTRSFAPYIHRNYGWATLAVLGAYAVEPHPYYLNAAGLFADHMIALQDPGTGVWNHPIGECTHSPRHIGGKVFMSGVNMTALCLLNDIAPSSDAETAVLRTCDWMRNRMWREEDNSFRYAQCPSFDGSSTHAGTAMACEGLARAARSTGSDTLRAMLLASLGDMLNRAPWGNGKGFAMQTVVTPYALAILEGQGITTIPPPAD